MEPNEVEPIADMPRECLGKRLLIPVKPMPPLSKAEQIALVKQIIEEHRDVLQALAKR